MTIWQHVHFYPLHCHPAYSRNCAPNNCHLSPPTHKLTGQWLAPFLLKMVSTCVQCSELLLPWNSKTVIKKRGALNHDIILTDICTNFKSERNWRTNASSVQRNVDLQWWTCQRRLSQMRPQWCRLRRRLKGCPSRQRCTICYLANPNKKKEW